MLGRPSVLTVDNVQATLENTSTYYIQVEGYQAVDLFKVEAGTVLRVTQHIIRNERGQTSIKLAVSVQDDQNDSKDAPVSDNSVPPIKQTKINTQAIVGAGQNRLLIGGYYYEQKVHGCQRHADLMHIPVLGNLFKTTSKGTKHRRRLILITPKVIHLDEIPTTPPRVDEPTFHRSPTQADYEERVPAAPQSGCSRKRPELETVTPATAIRCPPPRRNRPEAGAGTACRSAMSASGLIVFRLFGPPMGAELVLPAGNQLVGSDDSCDIILQDQFSRFPAREHRHRLFRGRRPVRAGDAARRRDTAQWRSLAVRRCGHPRAYAVFSGLDLHGMVGARRAGGRMASGRVGLQERRSKLQERPEPAEPQREKETRSWTLGDPMILLEEGTSVGANGVGKNALGSSCAPCRRRGWPCPFLLLGLCGLTFSYAGRTLDAETRVKEIQTIIDENGFRTLVISPQDEGVGVQGVLRLDAGGRSALGTRCAVPVYLDVTLREDRVDAVTSAFASRSSPSPCRRRRITRTTAWTLPGT